MIKMITDLTDGTPVQWVGTYVLKWPFDVLGPPEVGFVEDHESDPLPEVVEKLREERNGAIEVLKEFVHYILVLEAAGLPPEFWEDEFKSGCGMVVVKKDAMAKALALVRGTP
jgi:hypothetical protein